MNSGIKLSKSLIIHCLRSVEFNFKESLRSSIKHVWPFIHFKCYKVRLVDNKIFIEISHP